jgi:hypothetical protein
MQIFFIMSDTSISFLLVLALDFCFLVKQESSSKLLNVIQKYHAVQREGRLLMIEFSGGLSALAESFFFNTVYTREESFIVLSGSSV